MSEAPAGAAPRLLDARTLPLFALLCLGVWLNAADTLVTATIMPSVARDIGGYAFFAWGAAGYMLGAIIAGASAGRLSERFGVRGALAVSAGVYALGCVVSALAPSIAVFLTGRLVQGFGAGWIVGLCYVAIRSQFAEALWARVFAAIASVWGAATLLGPLVGGLFAGAGLWRWAFWMFAAQAAAFGIAAPLALKPLARREAGPGLALPQLALLGLAIALIAAAGVVARPGLSVALVACGLALLAAMLRVDRGARVRLLPREASDLRTTAGCGYAMSFCLFAATIGFSVYGPALLQAIHGLSPLQAGYVIATESIGWTLTALAVAQLPDRWHGPMIRLGVGAAVLGVAGVALGMARAPVAAVACAGLGMGGGFGLFWAFASRRILAGLPQEEAAIGSAALPTVQIIGNLTGAATAGVIANLLGLSHGFDAAGASHAAPWLFGAFVPVAGLGWLAANRLAANRLAGAPQSKASRLR